MENNTKLLKLNRFLAKKNSIAFLVGISDIILLMLLNYIINFFVNLPNVIGTNESKNINSIKYFFMNFKIFSDYSSIKTIYIVAILGLIIIDVMMIYKIETSFSEEDINIGQKGSRQWETIEEIKKQYKEIDLRETPYSGMPGFPICEHEKKLYIDDSLSNNLIVAITRVGKGEMFVFKSIEVYTRAGIKPSIVCNDMKGELYKSTKNELVKRGYKVCFLNLAQPLYSMGINILESIVNAYKNKEYDSVQTITRAITYQIFQSEKETGTNKYFVESAAQLFGALIIGITIDAIKEDIIINKKRKEAYKNKTQAFTRLSKKQQEKVRKEYYQYEVDVFLNYEVPYIPDEVEYFDINKNEKKINIYSVIHTFNILKNKLADPEKYITMLDMYFKMRPDDDMAKIKYSAIDSAVGKTKASIYTTMVSTLEIFTSAGIAKMTAESSIQLKDIGFGEKPIAVFLGIPDFDSSNNVLASLFVSQVYYELGKACWDSGKCKRPVKFILDEGGNMNKIKNLPTMWTIGLGRNMFFDLYLQNEEMLEEEYGSHGYKTIVENCANKIYIMGGSTKTAKNFSELIGSESYISVQRTGGRMDLNKTYLESVDEKPLIRPDELLALKPGECVIKRMMKRTDNENNPIEPKPIFNSIKTGTRFSFRYEYMEDLFPTPTTLSLKEINDESREHINLKERVWNPQISFRQYEEAAQDDLEMKFVDLPTNIQVAAKKVLKKVFDENFEIERVNELSVDDVICIINADNHIEDYEKKAIIVTIRSAGEIYAHQ